jgi:hypothetical protein
MERIVLVMIAAFVLSGCAGLQRLPADQPVVQKVIEAPGLTKDEIFSMSEIWLAENLRVSKAVTEYERKARPVLAYANKKEGILIGNGDIDYPVSGIAEGYKADREVTFTVREDVKDGRARVTFTNLAVYVPKTFCVEYAYGGWLGAYQTTLISPEDLNRVRQALLEMSDRLAVDLRTPGTGQEW